MTTSVEPTVEVEAPVVSVLGKLPRPGRMHYPLARLAADVVAAVLALLVAYLARPSNSLASLYVEGWRVPYDLLAVISIPLWLLCLTAAGAYRAGHTQEDATDYRLPVVTALELMAAVAVAAFAFNVRLSRLVVVAFFPSLIFFVFVLRLTVRKLVVAARKRGYGRIRLVLAGTPTAVRRFAEHVQQKAQHEYDIVGVCLPNRVERFRTRYGDLPVSGTPDEVVAAAKRLRADSVAVVGGSQFAQETLQKVAWRLERSGIELLVAPDVADLAGPRIRVTPIQGLPLLHITEPRIGGAHRHVKSAYERILAAPLLLLTSPMFLVAAIAILINSGRPIFYRQPRVGHRGKSFLMLKFRTMTPGAEEDLEGLLSANEHDGALFKIRSDPRVTGIGGWLRKFSIDELPQLINVLKGDMVLVGPRPCLERERQMFTEAAHRRFLAKPGMTGLWQVSGRADIPWEDAVLLDLYYVENWSPFLDLMITYRTLRAVLSGTGS